MLNRLSTSPSIHLFPKALFSTLPETSAKASWTIHQTLGHRDEAITVQQDGTIIQQSTTDAAAAPLPLSTQPQSSLLRSLKSQLASTFLPSGYPNTVAPGYLRFVGWQAAHHAAGAANGVLASTFLLYSVGLGAGAIPTAGALSWVLKDGLGQLGTLLFGRAMAHNFDVASRGWYVAASGKLNIAMGLEIGTALAPQWFLPIGAVANAVKGLAWMAGGSSRSAFNVAFAADRNIADVTAKATSQTICTTLIGTSAGMAIAAGVEQSVGWAFGWYTALAALHMWTSIESAACVPLATLNPSRLKILAKLALEGAEKLPSPAEIASQDPIFEGFGAETSLKLSLIVGAPLRQLVKAEPEVVAALLSLYKDKKYILLKSRDNNKMHLILHRDAGAVDAVTAVLHAVAWAEHGQEKAAKTLEQLKDDAISASNKAESSVIAVMEGLAAAGWDTKGVVLEPRRQRAIW